MSGTKDGPALAFSPSDNDVSKWPLFAQRTLRELEKTAREIRLDYLFHKRVPASMLATIACASATSGNAGVDANSAILDSEGRVWADRWCGRKRRSRRTRRDRA